MKNILISVFTGLLSFGVTQLMAQEPVQFETVEINGVVWMAQNLNIAYPGSYCYANNKAYCNKYGRLYNYQTAIQACPTGWHLPTKAEWDQLAAATGGYSVAGSKLKASGSSGFNADMGGIKKEGYEYFGIDKQTGFWTATAANPKQVVVFEIKSFSPVLIESLATPAMGYAIRCVEDNNAGTTVPGTK